MTEKRYGLWSNNIAAKNAGPQYRTWQEAKVEHDSLSLDIPDTAWRIWLHNDDGTVTDVTDGEPEVMWFCEWSKSKGYQATYAYIDNKERAGARLEGRVVESASAHILSTIEPTPEQFQAYVLAETGVKVPCVEEPRWWGWSSTINEWKPAALKHSYVEVWNDARSCCIYGTVSNRDEKRDALFAATKAAGKPEDEA